MTVSAPRKTVPAITIIVWIVGEGRHNNFGKRRVSEYAGVVMRSYHRGSLHATSTMFHLKYAQHAIKNPLRKSIESCEKQPPVFHQCQALKLSMLQARFLAPLKNRSQTPRRVTLYVVSANGSLRSVY